MTRPALAVRQEAEPVRWRLPRRTSCSAPFSQRRRRTSSPTRAPTSVRSLAIPLERKPFGPGAPQVQVGPRCVSDMCVCVAAYGSGYAWSPSSLRVFVGDTVRWRWEAPAFQSVGYRVFSVSSPSGSQYEGGALNSGEARTAEGRNTKTQNRF